MSSRSIPNRKEPRLTEQNMLTGRKLGISVARNRRQGSHDAPALGFSLLELMVVVAIIMVLLGMAAGRYQRSIQQANEAVLKQDLTIMRDAIEAYTADKNAGPQSLDDLISPDSKYLREIPVDPITRRKDWVAEFDQVLLNPDETTPGITGVHSASEAISTFSGQPYSKY
jgi:general secretion pathway protein G